MNSVQISLKQLFDFKEKELLKGQISVIESDEKMHSLKEKILEEIKGIKWTVALREIIKKIEDLLDLPVLDIMLKAWDKHRFLQKYLDEIKYSPEEVIIIPLAEHTIESEHRPYIEILINDVEVGRIEFNINISLRIKGILLKIQDKRIKEIQAGEFGGKGTIKYGDIVILEKDLVPILLPGAINLGEGVPVSS